MNSKLELRSEAIRIAASLEGVTSESLIVTAERIEKYIIGDTVLPDVMDMREMMKTFADLQGFKFKDNEKQEAQGLPQGMPTATV